MERIVGGYTIIEVLIVLAITALLFFSAITVFESQRGSTNFSQSVQDLNSKIQNYANQVVTSSYPGSENYNCSVNSNGRASLKTPGGSGTDCIFLGLAIQALTDQTSLNTYTILGSKDTYSGGDTGNPATTIDEANPEPAIDNNGGSPVYVLTDTYSLGASLSVKTSTATILSSGTSGPYNLVGLYNGLSNDSASGTSGSSALVLRGYTCNSPDCISPTPGVGQLKACIEGSSPCVNPPKLIQWKLCLQDGSNTAQLIVNGSPGGITSQVNFIAC
jgi:type II secretory pathway pseudopilin PulG